MNTPKPAPPKTVRTIPTSDLKPGMQVMKGGKVDVKLLSGIPAGACNGVHFLTTERRNVCWLPGMVDVKA